MGNHSGNNPNHGKHGPKGQPTTTAPANNRPQGGNQRPMAGQQGPWNNKQPQQTTAPQQPNQGKGGQQQPGQKR